MPPNSAYPPFSAPPLLAGGDRQTIAAAIWPFRYPRGYKPNRAIRHRVDLGDGDALLLHEDRPTSWQAGDPVLLYLHGLGSHAGSRFGLRIAGRFFAAGVSVMRMDLRGAGRSMPLAREPYHAGRSGDVAAALARIAQLRPGSDIGAVGSSIGGHLLLKALGEAGLGEHPGLPAALRTVAAICPPVHLSHCGRLFRLPRNACYNHRITATLMRGVARHRRLRPDAAYPKLTRRPGDLGEFDALITAPIAGFPTAEAYYRGCESIGLLGRIRLPSLLIQSRDDPLIPWRSLWRRPEAAMPCVVRELTDGGGHGGFLGRPLPGCGRWWLDGRLLSWFLPRLSGDG
jgi:predicted alpha/beta-fold hydrolase